MTDVYKLSALIMAYGLFASYRDPGLNRRWPAQAMASIWTVAVCYCLLMSDLTAEALGTAASTASFGGYRQIAHQSYLHYLSTLKKIKKG